MSCPMSGFPSDPIKTKKVTPAALKDLIKVDKEVSKRNFEHILRIWKRLQDDMDYTDSQRWGLIFDEIADLRENVTGEIVGWNDTFDSHGLGEKQGDFIPYPPKGSP